jgi:hypothetical protein
MRTPFTYVGLLVPQIERVGIGTSIVAKSAKADYLDRHPVKHGDCSISNLHFGTRLPGLHARRTMQNLSNWTMPATLRPMTASASAGPS